MTLVTLFTLLVTAACLLVLAAKLHKLIRSRADRTLRALCLFLAGLTASVGLQPFVPAIDAVTGVQMLGGFLGECAVLLAAGAGQAFLTRVLRPPGSATVAGRRRYCVLLLVVLVMAVIFVLGPTDWELPPGTSTAARGHLAILPRPYLYLYLYSAYLGITLIALTRMCLRYAPLTERRHLRTGLRVLTAACLSGLVYTVTSLVSDTMFEFGVNVDSWESATVTPLYLVTDVLLLAGCAIPAAAPLLAGAYRRLADRRARRRLTPLWQALCHANPEIVLFPADTRTELGMQLYRQVIEIRDGQLALRPYVDPRSLEIATTLCDRAGLTGEATQAIVEATAIATAIAAKSAGRPPRPRPQASAPTSTGADLAAEIRWLQQVSRAFQHSPIVARTLVSS
jgi:hypothetical protein